MGRPESSFSAVNDSIRADRGQSSGTPGRAPMLSTLPMPPAARLIRLCGHSMITEGHLGVLETSEKAGGCLPTRRAA